MSDFFLHTHWTPEQMQRAYEHLHRTRMQLEASLREIERGDPLARRFDVGDFGRP